MLSPDHFLEGFRVRHEAPQENAKLLNFSLGLASRVILCTQELDGVSSTVTKFCFTYCLKHEFNRLWKFH